MSREAVYEWLTEFKSLNDRDVAEFGESVCQNRILIESIMELIQDRYMDEEICGPLEALLLGVYNTEIFESESGVSKKQRIRIPSMAASSIYHDPANLASMGLTESALLSRRSNRNPYVIELGPYPAVVSLNAQNRFMVMTSLMGVYGSEIGEMHEESIIALCRTTSRLCGSGFRLPDGKLISKAFGAQSPAVQQWTKHPLNATSHADELSCMLRVPLHPAFLLELIQSIYYAMFNGFALMAMQALDDIHHRAGYELYPDVLLVTQAMINSLLENPSGQPSDGPMGLRVSSLIRSPRQDQEGRLVTNASLRIKKLPDDIPIRTERQDFKQSNAQSPKSTSRPLAGSAHPQRKSSRARETLEPVAESPLLKPSASSSDFRGYLSKDVPNSSTSSNASSPAVPSGPPSKRTHAPPLKKPTFPPTLPPTVNGAHDNDHVPSPSPTTSQRAATPAADDDLANQLSASVDNIFESQLMPEPPLAPHFSARLSCLADVEPDFIDSESPLVSCNRRYSRGEGVTVSSVEVGSMGQDYVDGAGGHHTNGTTHEMERDLKRTHLNSGAKSTTYETSL